MHMYIIKIVNTQNTLMTQRHNVLLSLFSSVARNPIDVQSHVSYHIVQILSLEVEVIYEINNYIKFFSKNVGIAPSQ